MYETVDALFTGICDAIRGKDGTTELISHQDIPARISAISSSGLQKEEKYYVYKSGQEMNAHNMSIFQYGSSSKRTDGWIYVHYLYTQVVSSDLIQAAGHKKVALTFLADATKLNNPYRFTILSLRDTPDVTLTNKDYGPKEGGTVFVEQDILRYPDTNTIMSGTIYVDIPEGIEEFYIVFSTVNVDFYIEEIWLE